MFGCVVWWTGAREAFLTACWYFLHPVLVMPEALFSWQVQRVYINTPGGGRKFRTLSQTVGMWDAVLVWVFFPQRDNSGNSLLGACTGAGVYISLMMMFFRYS